MIFSSLRIKLTLWYIGVLALMLFAFAAITYSIFVRAIQKETDDNLAEIARSLTASVTMEVARGEHYQPEERMVEALIDHRYHDYHCAFFTSSDKLISTTTNAELPASLPSDVGPNGYGDTSIGSDRFRVFLLPFTPKDQSYKLYVFTSVDDRLALEREVRRAFLILAPVLLLLAGIGGYFLARTSLRPISAMGRQAKRITASTLHERLTVVNEKDEIGCLAIMFNDLLDRLDSEFDRQRRFMADASHELRTPIAIIQGESEVALSNTSRPVEEYQDSLAIVNDESRRVAKIVEDLFTLARADAGELKPQFRRLYLDELVGESVRAVRGLAERRNITIDLTTRETDIMGDESLLRRLFMNLLDNAVKYNVDGGNIKVVVGDNIVRVTSTGPEIPEEQRPLIFERFYRAERARTRNEVSLTSGAGLGLSIARSIAQMHNAQLRYDRTEPAGNTFTLIFQR